MSDARGDDLRVGDPPASVSWPLGQETVHRAVNSCEQRVEVGVDRGPLGSAVTFSTADFDLPAYLPFPDFATTQAVSPLI